jgi:hypothetical protein
MLGRQEEIRGVVTGEDDLIDDVDGALADESISPRCDKSATICAHDCAAFPLIDALVGRVASTTQMAMNRLLIVLGTLIVVAGLCWPWLKRVPLFHLPGDVVIDRPGFKFMFPITTMLIVSAVLSLLAWLLRR